MAQYSFYFGYATLDNADLMVRTAINKRAYYKKLYIPKVLYIATLSLTKLYFVSIFYTDEVISRRYKLYISFIGIKYEFMFLFLRKDVKYFLNSAKVWFNFI